MSVARTRALGFREGLYCLRNVDVYNSAVVASRATSAATRVVRDACGAGCDPGPAEGFWKEHARICMVPTIQQKMRIYKPEINPGL